MSDLLRSIWAEPRPPSPPPRGWRDWALIGVIVPAAVVEGVVRTNLPWRFVCVLLVVGLTPTLLWRRVRPLTMLAIGFGVSGLLGPILTGGTPLASYAMAFLLILPYAVFRWGSGREIIVAALIIAAKAGVTFALMRSSRSDMIGGVVVLTAVAALGAALRYRAAARARTLDQIKLLERERLARDLHDTVAHHVSAIAIRAQAGLAMSAQQSDSATAALEVIEAEASRALAEMRSMVRVLRRDEPLDLTPTPGIREVAGLAGRERGEGPAVDVEIVGDPDGLPPSIDAAIYRLAQESVTNARRHARHATRVEVRVAVGEESVLLRVSDDGELGGGSRSGSAAGSGSGSGSDSGSASGSGPTAAPTAPTGYGLVGMIERADLLGGTCKAGPDPGRGWTVTAVLPRRGPAAA